MFKIEKVEMENFMCLKKFAVDFSDQGLILVSGPNGSGKSTIYEAVLWCLFGKTARKTHVDDVVNDARRKDCMVTVKGILDGKPIRISRFRRHTVAGNDLVVVYDGNLMEGNLTDKQDRLEKLLDFDFNKFLLVSSFIPERMSNFASASASQRLSVLSGILNMEKFDRAYEIAKDRLRDYKIDYSSLSREIEILESNLEAIDSEVEHYQKLLEQKKLLTESKKKELTNERRRVIYRLKVLEKELKAAPPNWEEKESDLLAKKEKILKKLREVRKRLASTEAAIENWTSLEVEKYEGKPCPVCQRPISKNLVERVKREAVKKVNYLTGLKRTTLREVQKYEEELEKVEKALSYVRTESSIDREQFSMKQREKEELKKRLEEIKSMFDTVSSEILTLQHLISQKVQQREEVKKNYEEAKEKFGEVEEMVEIEGIVKEIFGKKGVKVDYVGKVLSVLEEETKKVLHILSDYFDVNIVLNTKNEIELIITKNGVKKRYEDCSSGEKHRIELALSFGMNRTARAFGFQRTNFLFLDEIFDRALDEEGQERAFSVLKELATENETVFVVSHRPELQAQFEKVIRMG